MINLRRISTAVLFCLVLAAPASAASPIHLSVPASAYLGSPVTYQLSGEPEPTRHFRVGFLHTEVPGACAKALKGESSPATTVASGQVLSGKFEEHGSLPTTLYEALGTYYVCAAVQTEEPAPAETYASFTVVPAPPPPPPVVTPPTPPAPVVTPPAPVVTPPVVHPPLTSAQKLHAALAKCKKQKNKRKRVKCERTARSAARHH